MIVLVRCVCQENAKNDMVKRVEISYDGIKTGAAHKG